MAQLNYIPLSIIDNKNSYINSTITVHINDFKYILDPWIEISAKRYMRIINWYEPQTTEFYKLTPYEQDTYFRDPNNNYINEAFIELNSYKIYSAPIKNLPNLIDMFLKERVHKQVFHNDDEILNFVDEFLLNYNINQKSKMLAFL